ncbi:glycoside hydrolase family 1 protein [Clostridium weizhouense]|uniref:beta-glucosidase n=1 Tax=Clostridium weizhouense TaxID=2859781 RepID=A0ABS7AJT1_9CLOT|nr:glycoside hydrolase family 1 protein [Clostridium weizhouense]MBW6408924.1 glycoside hydrolase family 1 protein [Clostridium weizhouense]
MEKFLWGTATASYQCEGAWNEDGRVESMWDYYLHKNNFESGDMASDHYHRYKEDIKYMKDGGHNTYRFSLAWPRIIKNIDGDINPEGIEFYHKLIDECINNGITPFVTIYHWDLPQFLEEKGGWINKETIDAYIHYVNVIFKEFGEKVKYFVTFNEPRYFIFSGYKIGNYPPGLQNTEFTIKGSYYVMLANARAIAEYRKHNLEGKIGIVHSFAPIFGIDDTLETKIAIRNADNFMNNWILDTAAKGEIPIDLLTRLSMKYDLSYITAEDMKVIKENTVDFIGLNYYARALVKPYTEGETTLIVNNSGSSAKGTSKLIIKDWFEQVFDPASKYTEWDTEVYPRGLYEGIMMVHNKYRLPIFVTENGVASYEDVSKDEPVNDDYRIEFLNDHIAAILNAKDEGADVRGYYIWSTMDLYSWKNGCKKRYGLVAVDWDNGLVRKPKKSYYWFKEVCESNGEIIDRRDI